MEKDWLNRLIAAIENDGRSMRAISIAAGCGPNFVQQMVRTGREPGADHLTRILDTLGRDAALYVMSGIKITEDDLDFLRAMQGLSAESRADALRFFRGLKAGEDAQEPETETED